MSPTRSGGQELECIGRGQMWDNFGPFEKIHDREPGRLRQRAPPWGGEVDVETGEGLGAIAPTHEALAGLALQAASSSSRIKTELEELTLGILQLGIRECAINFLDDGRRMSSWWLGLHGDKNRRRTTKIRGAGDPRTLGRRGVVASSPSTIRVSNRDRNTGSRTELIQR